MKYLIKLNLKDITRGFNNNYHQIDFYKWNEKTHKWSNLSRSLNFRRIYDGIIYEYLKIETYKYKNDFIVYEDQYENIWTELRGLINLLERNN